MRTTVNNFIIQVSPVFPEEIYFKNFSYVRVQWIDYSKLNISVDCEYLELDFVSFFFHFLIIFSEASFYERIFDSEKHPNDFTNKTL